LSCFSDTAVEGAAITTRASLIGAEPRSKLPRCLPPAAHTFKGLAKAFVSSAGGKGPENRDTPALLSCAQRREVTL
jgi:hypothetical protein